MKVIYVAGKYRADNEWALEHHRRRAEMERRMGSYLSPQELSTLRWSTKNYRWEDSAGTIAELRKAIELGIEVVYEFC